MARSSRHSPRQPLCTSTNCASAPRHKPATQGASPAHCHLSRTLLGCKVRGLPGPPFRQQHFVLPRDRVGWVGRIPHCTQGLPHQKEVHEALPGSAATAAVCVSVFEQQQLRT
uniref:Uncharacterized protein n=1 Tax=Sphaerodactylus townsendi TaxID=933632 RepID=A0ACB8F0S8_9SAUR